MRYALNDYSKTAAQKGWGAGWPTCTAKSQIAKVTAPISGVTVVVHKRIARLVYLLIAETERRGYLLRAGQCWGGNCRAIAGTNVSSNHAWWIAVDLNSLANAYVAKVGGRPVTDMPAWLPLLWNAFGFAWGGDYSGAKADAMHEEFMGSPEDADDMTALAEQRLAPGLGSAAPAPEENAMNGDQQNRVYTQLDVIEKGLGGLLNAVSDPARGIVPQLARISAQLDGDDVDEAALAALLGPELKDAINKLTISSLSRLSEEELQAIATAVADENARRQAA